MRAVFPVWSGYITVPYCNIVRDLTRDAEIKKTQVPLPANPVLAE